MSSILEQLISGEAVVVENAENMEPVSEEAIANVTAAALLEAYGEAEIDELIESANNGTVEFSPVEERTIVKLDKKAKKQKAYKMAVYQAAREMKLKEYNQIKTLWEAERELDARIEKKCHNRALQIMRESAKKQKESPVTKIKNIGHDLLTRSQKKTQNALKGTVKMNSNVQNKAKQVANKYA